MQKRMWVKRFISVGLVGVLWLSTVLPVYASEGNNTDELQQNSEVQEKTENSEEYQQGAETEYVTVSDATLESEEENPTSNEDISLLNVNRTQTEAVQWVKSQVGKSLNMDGVYGAQCVDLILAYYDYLGVPRSSGNGSDYTWNTLPNGWSRIQGATPQPGDILVYTGGFNNYGHVAIFESTRSTYHQNFDGHSYVERVTYSYNGLTTPYWGVIRPDWNSYGQGGNAVNFVNDDCQWDTTNAYFYTKATANFRGTFTEAGMTVWDSVGNVVANKTEYINTQGSYLEIWYNITEDTGVQLISGQRYKYQMYTVFNGNRYTGQVKTFITNSIAPGEVTGTKAYAAGKNRVQITWNPVQNAQGYLIYTMKNGGYSYCGMTDRNWFIDKKALDTQYNFYWVFPYVQNADGKIFPGECKKYVYAKGIIPAVKNLKGLSTTSGAKLTWSKATGADGYLIYGRVNGKNYGYVGETTGTTFVDKKAGKNIFSFYWVFPYHRDKNGKIIPGNISTKYVYGKKL